MFRKPICSLLFLAGWMVSLAACQPARPDPAPANPTAAALPTASQPSAAPPTAAQPARTSPATPVPVTGSGKAEPGASALTFQHTPGTEFFSIVPVSAETGKPTEGLPPVRVGSLIGYAFSTDRTKMAFVSNHSTDCPAGCLNLLDLTTWKHTVHAKAEFPNFNAWYVIPSFPADSPRLVIILNKSNSTSNAAQFLMVDLAQGKVTLTNQMDGNVLRAAYTPQGALAVYGMKMDAAQKQTYLFLALLDGTDLHTLWEKDLTEIRFMDGWWSDSHSDPSLGKYFEPAGVFTTDGSRLYIVAADRPRLVTVDFGKRTIRNATIQPRASLLDRLMALGSSVAQAKVLNSVNRNAALSADGRYLYVVGFETKAVKDAAGNYSQEYTPLGLQVVDTRDGALVRTSASEADNARLSTDGKLLLLTGWKRNSSAMSPSWTEVVDLETWEVVHKLDGITVPARLLDGSPAWLVTTQKNDDTYDLQLYREGAPEPAFQIDGVVNGSLDWLPIP